MPNDEETVIQFSPASKSTEFAMLDALDQTGQTILELLERVSIAAEDDRRHAIETTQGLSQKLRTAEGRIAELEADVASHRATIEHAERWLHRVYSEIEERFMRTDQNPRRSGSQRR